MTKPKIVIIEDELIIAETISTYLNKLGYTVVAKIKSLSKAMETLDKTEFDLALVDINIDGGEEGIELGKYFHQIRKPFIYLTSYSDPSTMEKVKRTKPDAFISKPFTQRDLYTNIEVVLCRREESSSEINYERIKLFDGYKQIFIQPGDIQWIQADGVYLKIKTTSTQFLQRTNFKEMLDRIPREVVQRVHRSWAVNLKHADEITSNSIKISDQIIPISKTYKKEIKI